MPTWIPEPVPAHPDTRMRAFFDRLPAGSVKLDLSAELVPGTWWRLEEDGEVVGYGWMDVTWGDAQVMLAVDPEAHRGGNGRAIVEHLAHEAHEQGLGFLFNTIPAGHPDPEGVRAFLTSCGFEASGLDGGLLRLRVRG
ncbi:MAG: GNAT family N-acetyltransferase [Myxococcales bacterium]|nr:GNAT family N-acetyltransferase [Myxococcales bacterium]